MENRIAQTRAERPGTALIALAVILAVTAAWWALALWPVGTVEPEWLARTRAACFGATHGGLPDAGGWILLVGEPIGMIGVLFAVWGRSLKHDLTVAWARPHWRFAVAAVGLGSLAAAGLLGVRIARAGVIDAPSSSSVRGVQQRMDREVPAISFVDQHGRRLSLSDFGGHLALVTFAYGHCNTVCPSNVHDLIAARRKAGRPDIPIVVITVDPWRDTPDRLATIAASWRLEPQDRVLSGEIPSVEAALDQLGIGRRRNETTGDIDHGATAMILDARSRITSRMDGVWFNVADLLRSSP
jgi:cytochrome oxidase Cu insertion factor (SCO1/SenC/PrrC family)